MRDRYGPPAVVEVWDVEKPTPTGDEMLVRVHAASVNRADLDNLYPRWGFLRLFLGLRAPRNKRLGEDVAGVVEAVGAGVTQLKPGDAVFADLYNFGQGAFAEYVCASEKAFQKIPAGMSFADAATLPHSAVLAVQGLRRRNGSTFGPGAKVMISGASGNVGPFAVQIAKSRGAEVTGIASTDKVEFVRSLGADHVIDYKKVDYMRSDERYDWILDVDAHHSILRWRHLLRPKGVYAALGGPAGWFLTSALIGPVVSLATRKSVGPDAVVEAVRSDRRRDTQGADRGRQTQAAH